MTVAEKEVATVEKKVVVVTRWLQQSEIQRQKRGSDSRERSNNGEERGKGD